MKADASLYLAYEYGAHSGRPASEVIHYPVDELLGFIAYKKINAELIKDNGG
jgi:hypothetical protein